MLCHILTLMYICANLRKFYKMRIHKEGYPFILVVVLLAFIVSEMSYLYLSKLAFLLVLCPTLILATIVTVFFRNPVKRKKVVDDNGVISPADGTVVAIEKVFESEYLKEERIQVSIFMSIYNVHKNFFPIPGEVSYHKHHNGNFHRACLPKSSVENEHSTIVIKNENGEILFRQIAGAVARRIVSYVEVGQQVEQSTEMGFIKFGSRVDVLLPLNAEVKVKVGDKAVGSRTLLAKL